MLKQTLALAGILAILPLIALTAVAHADETGMVGGAIAGAVVGGPVGAVVGGVVGNSMTDHRYHRHCWVNHWGHRECNY